MSEWDRCRWAWNQSVATSRAAHALDEECGPVRIQRELTVWRAEHEWLRAGSSVVQQQVLRDFSTARAKALLDRKNKLPMRQRRGMPLFKKRGVSPASLNYTKRGFSIREGRLILAGGLSCAVVWSRELPSEPASVRVFQDSLGHWYASFVVEIEVEELPVGSQPIGVDWGVRQTATTTDELFDLDHSEFDRAVQLKATKYQRMMARRKPARGQETSKGYELAKRAAAKERARARRQRSDAHNKWAKRIVREHHQLAVEDFKPKFLAKTKMARKSQDAGIALAKQALVWQAAKHGRDLRLIDPKYTTQDCSECGARAKHHIDLSMRIYECASCGMLKTRDRNSADLMVVRAGFDPADTDRISLECPQGSQAA